jgi:hypothetical protein
MTVVITKGGAHLPSAASAPLCTTTDRTVSPAVGLGAPPDAVGMVGMGVVAASGGAAVFGGEGTRSPGICSRSIGGSSAWLIAHARARL